MSCQISKLKLLRLLLPLHSYDNFFYELTIDEKMWKVLAPRGITLASPNTRLVFSSESEAFRSLLI